MHQARRPYPYVMHDFIAHMYRRTVPYRLNLMV